PAHLVERFPGDRPAAALPAGRLRVVVDLPVARQAAVRDAEARPLAVELEEELRQAGAGEVDVVVDHEEDTPARAGRPPVHRLAVVEGPLVILHDASRQVRATGPVPDPHDLDGGVAAE